jgi:UDP-N-acetylmuramyl tripeptide synthase
MTDISTVAGRYAVFDRDGRRARLLLAKNPAGWLETLSMIRDSDAPVAIVFNSEGVDGRDPSWLYDVSFEGLRGRQVVVSGRRATDMLVRLRFARVDHVQAYPRLTEALATLPPGPVDVLANYTAFQEARAELGHG